MKTIVRYLNEARMPKSYKVSLAQEINTEYAEMQESLIQTQIDYDEDAYIGEINNTSFEFEVEVHGDTVNILLTNSAYTKDGFMYVTVGESKNNKNEIIKAVFNYIKKNTPNANDWEYRDF